MPVGTLVFTHGIDIGSVSPKDLYISDHNCNRNETGSVTHFDVIVPGTIESDVTGQQGLQSLESQKRNLVKLLEISIYRNQHFTITSVKQTMKVKA